MKEPPLVVVDNLPAELLRSLSYSQMQQIGDFLYPQLEKQRDADVKHYEGYMSKGMVK